MIQAKIVLLIHMSPITLSDSSLTKDYDDLHTFLENNGSFTGDVMNLRKIMVQDVEKFIQNDLDVRSLFYSPTDEQKRLQTLLEQSLNWQHKDCLHSTVFASFLNDHHCTPQPLHQNQNMNDQTLANNNTSSSLGGFFDRMLNVFNGQSTLNQEAQSPWLQELLDGLVAPPPFLLPKDVIKVLDISHITGLEFHPQLPLILVCTTSGEIRLFNLTALNYPNRKEFKIWKLKTLSQGLKDHFLKNDHKTAGAVCVAWGSHGNNTNYAVGFSEGLVQTYNYIQQQSPKQQLEIEAHSGPVNDIVFYSSQGELKIVTCGDDKHIRGWNSSNGTTYWALAHTASLNSLALHQDGNTVQLFTSDVYGTAMKPNIGHDGKPDAYPLIFESVMIGRFELKFSSDGKRLFCCGVEPSTQGSGGLLELDIQSLRMRREYNKVMNPQTKCMDICKNGYIAVGDEHSVKVWQLDNGEEYFTRISLNNDLNFPECPMVKFNREGTLLAVVSPSHLRILANADGKSLLSTG